MFTGIVQTTGSIAERQDTAQGDARLRIASPGLPVADLALGDSIAVSGVCLTATRFEDDGFWADVSAETLGCTTLGDLYAGSHINLETALRVGDALGGHLVSGHVDGVGHLAQMREDARSMRLTFRYPRTLAGYVAAKGSICIDGISLTVNDVCDDGEAPTFGVNIVPHTMSATTLGEKQPGAAVNLEVDQVARYLERLLAAR